MWDKSKFLCFLIPTSVNYLFFSPKLLGVLLHNQQSLNEQVNKHSFIVRAVPAACFSYSHNLTIRKEEAEQFKVQMVKFQLKNPLEACVSPQTSQKKHKCDC